MAIIRTERIDLPSGEQSPDDDTLTARWRLYSNNRFDGPLTALSYNGVPKFGAPYEIDGQQSPAFRVVDRNCDLLPQGRNRVFELTNKYSTKFTATKFEAKELKPLDRTPKVSRSFVEVEEPLVYDKITTELILNKAGEPIVGLRCQRLLTVYDVTGNFEINPYYLEDINGTINSKPLTIYGKPWKKHQVLFRLTNVSDLKFENEQYFYEVKAQAICDPSDWGHKQHILNAGLNERDPTGAASLRPCRLNEVDVTQPVPLDINGHQISTAALVAAPDTAPVYLDFAGWREVDLATVGFPASAYQPS